MNKNDMKNIEEKEVLNHFLGTEIGKNWYRENSIIEILSSESPDFLFKTADNMNIGLEITKFFVEHKNRPYSQILTRIGNQLCTELQKKRGVNISMVIDKYDKREFSIYWKDYIDAAYNPGFSELPNIKIFKTKLKKAVYDNVETLKSGGLIQQWFQVGNDSYKVSAQCFPSISSGAYDCHVNNCGEVKFNMFAELQNCINKKNKKIKKYQKNLNKCCLLVMVPDSKIGNYCSFTDEIHNYNFISEFDSTFVYMQSTNKVFSLNT